MSVLNHIRVGHQSAGRDLATVEPAVPDASGIPMEERIKQLFDRNVHSGTGEELTAVLKASEGRWSAGALLPGPRELES